jgi:hypothetical protein
MQTPKTFAVATVVLLMFVWPANSQDNSETPSEVKAIDVLGQIDAVIVNDSLTKRKPEETLELVKQMIMLNKMQISMTAIRNGEKSGKRSIMPLAGFNQTFYDLRASVCKRYPGMVVDLDGTLRHCN